MAVTVTELRPEVRPQFEALLQHAWQANWGDDLGRAIAHWRYFDRPNGPTWVLLDGERCVGLLDSMVRPHVLNGQLICVRETADWFCLPEYRTGYGLALIRKAMALDEPILVVGGSAATQGLLPKLRFTAAPPARHYVLPITTRGLAANMLRQLWWRREDVAKYAPNFSLRRSPRLRRPDNVEIQWMNADTDPHMPCNQCGLVQIVERSHWQWLLNMPGDFAVPIGLMFYQNGQPIGRSISQLEPSATGFDGRILHMQWHDPAIATWLLRETVETLASCGAGFIRCRASTAEKFAAVEAAGFRFSRIAPTHWFSRHIPCPDSVDAGYLRADDALPWAALRGRRIADRPRGGATGSPARRSVGHARG